jgi:hypothetical protein
MSKSIPVRTAAAAVMGGALLLALVAPPAGAYDATKPPRSETAGYSGNVAEGVTTVTATVTLPTITCVKKRPAVDVTLQLTGNGEDDAGVGMGCLKVRHTPGLVRTYVPFVAANFVSPTTGSVNPMPGDTITMTLTCSPAGQSATLDDVTSSEVLASTSTAPPSIPCDYLLVGSGAGNSGLPEMNSFAWTGVTVNGAPLSSVPLSASNWFWTLRKATLTTSPLTIGGTAFTESYAPPAL